MRVVPFQSPLFSLVSALVPVPNLLTSSGLLSVCNLCLLIRAAILAFSSARLLASFSLISFSICNCLAFSACNLLFSFLCLSSVQYVFQFLFYIISGCVIFGYFIYINLFIIWYLLSLLSSSSIGLYSFYVH